MAGAKFYTKEKIDRDFLRFLQKNEVVAPSADATSGKAADAKLTGQQLSFLEDELPMGEGGGNVCYLQCDNPWFQGGGYKRRIFLDEYSHLDVFIINDTWNNLKYEISTLAGFRYVKCFLPDGSLMYESDSLELAQEYGLEEYYYWYYTDEIRGLSLLVSGKAAYSAHRLTDSAKAALLADTAFKDAVGSIVNTAINVSKVTSASQLAHNKIAVVNGAMGGMVSVTIASYANGLRRCQLLITDVAEDKAVSLDLPAATYKAVGVVTTTKGDNLYTFQEYDTNMWVVTKEGAAAGGGGTSDVFFLNADGDLVTSEDKLNEDGTVTVDGTLNEDGTYTVVV